MLDDDTDANYQQNKACQLAIVKRTVCAIQELEHKNLRKERESTAIDARMGPVARPHKVAKRH